MLTTQAEAGTPGKSSFAEEAETDPPLGIKYFYQRNDPDSSAASIIKLDLMVRAERHVGATDNFREKTMSPQANMPNRNLAVLCRSMSPATRKCYFSHEKTLQPGALAYSEANCVLRCAWKRAMVRRNI